MDMMKEIEVSQGRLVGCKRRSVYDNKEYYSFQGIPYAEPPVGKLRFKDPVPLKSWEGVKQCTKHGNICPQFHELTHALTGNEDCLFLNVYTQKPSNGLKPVMVWIHGGGFTFGSGNDEIHGPDYFVQKDIVLVTINYRVGVFGFLCLGNTEVPGNAGLKDQTLALKWVQENIHNFGGDPKNVTIFGESAGASAVQYHSISPMSKGLFHRVIMQSGSALNPWAFVENSVPRAYKLSQLLGKKTNDADELISFLRDQSVEALINNQSEILTREEEKKSIFPFVPCKETAGTGANFIVETPETLLKRGQFADVPYIIGMNDKEGLILLKDPGVIDKLDKIYADTIRFVPHDLRQRKDVWEAISLDAKKYYFGDAHKGLTIQTLAQFLDLWADLEFTNGINKTLKYLAIKGQKKVYTYLFSFEGKCGYLKLSIKTPEKLPTGVCHADEIGYLFHNNSVNGNKFNVDANSPEKRTIDNMITLWTNFAAKGDPNGENLPVDWKTNNPDDFKYLNIRENLVMENSKLMKDRDDFWEKTYATYSPAPK